MFAAELVPVNSGGNSATSAHARLERGFTLLSYALLVHAFSSISGALSTGLYGLSGPSAIGFLPIMGAIFRIIGIGLLVIVFILMAGSVTYSKRAVVSLQGETPNHVRLERTFMITAYAFLIPIGMLAYLSWGRHPTRDLAEVVLTSLLFFLLAGAAFSLLAAMSLPVTLLSKVFARTLANVGFGLGVIAVVSELTVSLMAFGRAPGTLEIVFGGYPLLNLSLPFGTLLSVGLILVWRASRSVQLSSLWRE